MIIVNGWKPFPIIKKSSIRLSLVAGFLERFVSVFNSVSVSSLTF